MNRAAKTILAAVFFFGLAAFARCDGFIVLDRVRPSERPVPMAVKYHHVKVKIRDQVATTSVDQVFVNPNNMRLEGTYIFPLPDNAALSRMSMWIDGREVEGEMLPRDQAVKIYTDIVRSLKDPAILEYMGTRLFRMRVFPIEPRGEKRIRIEYSETVSSDAGLCTYRYPLSTEKFSSRPLDEVVITVDLGTTIPLKTVFSPSHEVEVVKKSDFSAAVGYEKRNVLPTRDFFLYYSLSDREFGASAVTFRRAGEDGYFAFFVSPRQEVAAAAIVAKDVVFVIDTSGSMKEPARKPWKIDQAKGALAFCIKSLNERDRFNVVSFATATRKFRETLQPATGEFVEEALAFVDGMKAGGGTNIQAALEDALSMQEVEGKRPLMIVFLTDGLPTVGDVQDAKELVALVKAGAGQQTRLFAFGVGYDVNTHLLDRMALMNRGERMYVAPEENIEVKVSGFYEKIASPVLSDVEIAFDGIETYDLFPAPFPDLFKGSQLVVYGRYKGSGNKAVRLRGQVNARSAEFVYECSFAEKSSAHPQIPRLWATTRIGYLLDQLRLKGIDPTSGRRTQGPEKELIDEVVRLATEFGVVTPYTALLVLEDARSPGGPATSSPLADRLAEAEEKPEARKALKKAPAGFRADTGQGAVEASESAGRLRKGWAGSGEKSDIGLALDVAGTVRRIGDKTFFLVKDVWQDSVYREGAATTKIVFLSDAYFELVTRHPEIARYLSAGSRTILCIEEAVYEIVAGQD
jgi:Ca-activated chloride channel homolog